MKKLMTFAAALALAVFTAEAGWKDKIPVGKDSVVVKTKDGEVRIDPLAANLFRVRVSKDGVWMEGALNRYAILKRDWEAVKCAKTATSIKTDAAEISVNAADGAVRFRSLVSAADLTIGASLAGKGYEVRFPLADGERVYGLGDVSRENIQRRPGKYEIWVKNVNSYIPMPMALTSKGWGVLMNTTWRNYFDVGETDRSAMVCTAPESELDFYVFAGADYRALLDIYTQLTGRPSMLPSFGYGFTYVANEEIDMFNMLHEAREFRDRDLPCDVYGLEPGWMDKHYDFSTTKTWSKDRFIFPYWSPKGPHTCIGALNRMGFKLSLWLCVNYDLFRYEEQCSAGMARKFGLKPDIPENITETWQDDRITGELKDPRLTGNNKMMYEKLGAKEGAFKEGDLPWFEHLKKFVDQGAQCFKLDGSCQVTDWNGVRNRKWANGKSDEENHNAYPLVYGKQMSLGYEEYTQKRSMVYSAGGYAGIQQYVATWAGDTGGGPKPCASLLNLGMSGHANQSCDMDINNVRSLHFGMLQTWSQQNNWAYFYQPWYRTKDKLDVFRSYLKLRYRLIPYLYTAAAEANRTGWPVMRSLPFVYPDVKEYDECKTTYMLGSDLLVAAFTDEAAIPAGKWYEWRTDAVVNGPSKARIAVSQEWGGGLYVKAGSIIPTWPEIECIDAGWNRDWILEAYVGADGQGEVYEDDGLTLAYRKDVAAHTPLALRDVGKEVTLSVGKRAGTFNGCVKGRNVTVRFHGFVAKPAEVLFGGKAIDSKWDETAKTLTVAPVDIDAAGGTFTVKR